MPLQLFELKKRLLSQGIFNMKAKLSVLLATLSACLLSGCYINGNLYPLQGPLAAQTPTPVLHARMSGPFNSGALTVVLSGGEVCKGTWKMIGSNSTPPTQESAGVAVNFPSAWDMIYGQGFYTANVLGNRLFAQSTLTGNKGTTLNVELYRSDAGQAAGDIKGVAIDSNGNLYKVVFEVPPA